MTKCNFLGEVGLSLRKHLLLSYKDSPHGYSDQHVPIETNVRLRGGYNLNNFQHKETK